MAGARVFYTITVKADEKKRELEKFLKKEWLPALLATEGCLQVELLDDYKNRPGYCIWEYWESEDAHRGQVWSESRKTIWQKMFQFAIIENIWECRVVETRDKPR